MTTLLEKEFKGAGEVKGFNFKQAFAHAQFYVYEVRMDTSTWFEVFMRKTVPLCIDFDKKIFSDTDDKEVYPKSNDFGIWAWTASTLDHAIAIANRKQLNITTA